MYYKINSINVNTGEPFLGLSIIIVNYNSKEVLRNCLRSIIQSNFSFPYEIFVIDNASDESIEELVVEYPTFQFIFNESNYGFAYANNIGIAKSRGKFILLLNPDTIVNSNSFQPMMDYLEQHNDVGIVGCKIFHPSGDIERSTHSFPTLLKEFVHANQFLKLFFGYQNPVAKLLSKIITSKSLESYWDHNSVKEVDHVTGACMMFKKEVIAKAGKLDEAFFLYNEEVEWSYRIKKAGYKSVFIPDSSIIHLFGYSTKQRVQKQTVNPLLVERYRGMLYFFQKHRSFIALMLLRLIIIEGFTIRLIFNVMKKIVFMKRSTGHFEENCYIKSIISLAFGYNFDWRKRK